MDKKAFYKLSYGVFLLTTKTDTKVNGCITNTCIQAAGSPERVAICVLNTNYTCDLIKESGVFTVGILDESCTFETIKQFGYQSGRDVDKFEGMSLPTDVNGVPYITWQTNAVLSCKVADSMELGSHTLFIGEVVDAQVLNDKAPLTYADYQERLKPKQQAVNTERRIVGWRCKICNYVYEGETLPDDFMCPKCGHPKEDFEPIYA